VHAALWKSSMLPTVEQNLVSFIAAVKINKVHHPEFQINNKTIVMFYIMCEIKLTDRE